MRATEKSPVLESALARRLERVSAGLSARLRERLLGVALFGSYARGDARRESDVDLFVVVRGSTEETGLPLPLDDPGDVGDAPIRILLRTAEQFEADVAPLDLDLALDAVVLFERDAYLTLRLARLRALIAQAGLVRGADLFWDWRVAPTRPDWAITWQGVQR